MVKTPRTRHSDTGREPMTIELGPADVSRVAADDTSSADASEATPKDAGASETDAEFATASNVSEPETSPESPQAAPAPESAGTQPPRGGEEAAPHAAASRPEPYSAPRARPSRGSALAAGIAGGIIALLAGGTLQYAGVLGSPGPSEIAPSALPAAFEAEIDALKSEIETLKTNTGAPADMGSITAQIGSLSEALDAVKGDVATLKQAVEAGSGGNAGLEAVNTKIAEIETRIASIGPGPDGATPQEVAAVNERIAGVEALARAAGEAGQATDARLGALEQSVSALTTKVEGQAGQPKIALAIAASALKAAIERGAPFMPEVETFAAVAPTAPDLGELRSYAEKGLATRADILAETDDAAKAMIAAANPPPADAGFFERLLSSAESLVTVRPIGAVEGPGVPETVARMEVALQAGDLAKAVAEYDTLPEAAKAAGAPFAEKIRARLAAEQLADQAIATAMQAA